MKNSHTVLKLVAATLLTCTAGLAAAAGSQTLAVTARVSGLCKFSATSTPLAFGAIDPSSTVNATASARVVYKCTKGTKAAVTAAGGVTRSMTSTTAGSTDTLGYTLAFTGDTQVGLGFAPGTGTDLTMAVAGTITPAQFQNATVGGYKEDVTLNVLP